MAFVLPFDGSELAAAALVRADEYAGALDVDVTVVSVIPDSRHYAVEKGWIDRGDDVSPRDIVASLHRRATDLAPGASFESRRLDGRSECYLPQ